MRLTQHPGLDAGARWSPDGRWLVFHSDRTSGTGRDLDLFLADPHRPDAVQGLTDSPGFDYLPDVSPDGRRIAFLSRRPTPESPQGTDGHLFVQDVEGGDGIRITRDPVSASLGPRWTSDGGALLFARRMGSDGPTRLLRIPIPEAVAPGDDPAGGSEVELVADTFFNYTPAPSADGRWLAYTAEADAGTRVILIRSDGSEPRILVSSRGEGPRDYVREWTPDGRWILVDRWDRSSDRTEAWLLSVDRSAPDRPLLLADAPPVYGVSFRPGPAPRTS